MKKFTVFMAAALCLVGLTACSSKESATEFESRKLQNAEAYAEAAILPSLNCFVDGSYENYEKENNITVFWDELSMDEVAYYADKVFGIEADGYGFYNARTSFMAAKDTVGAVVVDANGNFEHDDIESYISGLEIIVTIPNIKCENGEANAEVIFSNDRFLKLQSASLNENYTIGQKMSKAGLNTLMGMGTVFSVLILISLLISIFGVIPKIQKSAADKKAAKAAKSAAETGIDNAVNQIIANETAEEDDTELVAVIAAAIAAYEGSGSTDGYVVRSIRRRR